jgi:hypothetical protein
MVHPGSFSDGLITLRQSEEIRQISSDESTCKRAHKVLPVVSATGIIHKGIMAGKLKGQMPSVEKERWLKSWG